jgi:hypothetical protein
MDNGEQTLNEKKNTDTSQLEYIDKFTLECLMNKSQYSRYLSKTDPKKYEERTEYYEKIAKYREPILKEFEKMMDNDEEHSKTEVTERFHDLIHSFIDYFDNKSLEEGPDFQYEKYGEEDEDVLFGNMDEEREPSKNSKSYWGKSLKKSSDLLLFSTNMYKQK